MKHLSTYVSRDVLIQLYKLYVRPHLDYGDIISHKYDPSMRLDFTNKLEQSQYAAALAATGAWKGTSRDRLYQELGFGKLCMIGDDSENCVIFQRKESSISFIPVF